MICIGIFLACVQKNSENRNFRSGTPRKNVSFRKCDFRGLRLSLGHFGRWVPESPFFQLQNGVSTSSLPPFVVDLSHEWWSCTPVKICDTSSTTTRKLVSRLVANLAAVVAQLPSCPVATCSDLHNRGTAPHPRPGQLQNPSLSQEPPPPPPTRQLLRTELWIDLQTYEQTTATLKMHLWVTIMASIGV